MKRIPMLLIGLICAFASWAQSYSESYNIVSDAYNNKIENIKVIRNINGGTVIIPIFDESCPEELKAPFRYACKIVEEYIPSSLPIKVKVSVDEIPAQFGKSISRVQANIKDGFGDPYIHEKSVTTSQIKGIIYGEMGTNANNTFRPYVPDVAFLADMIDIDITYNLQYLSELSFSIDTNPQDKYDYVSVVIRDLLKGLGLSSSFRYSSQTKGLDNPKRPLTDFEIAINKALGENNSPVVKLANATKGHIGIPYNTPKKLQLYAPTTWKNLISLNYFIPQTDSDVSNILSSDFCKGMVYRSLSDNYQGIIFNNLLGWIPNKASGSDAFDYNSYGSTSMLMPYDGSMSIPFDTASSNDYRNNDSEESIPVSTSFSDLDNESSELTKFFNAFHPFFTGEEEFYGTTGTSISILKKDGTWDLMELKSSSPNFSYKMSDWTFHFDESEYARTIDGYLRGRITYMRKGYYGNVYDSKYFVLDYLPQKVVLSHKLISNTRASVSDDLNAAPPQYPVRIYFSNTEGIERIVLERLKEGARIPNKITITDIKKGYYETTIDINTTFTAVSYNKNGAARGLPLNVVLPSSSSYNIQARIDNNSIKIESSSTERTTFAYDIRSLDADTHKTCPKGFTEEGIDISSLVKGNYVLVISDDYSSKSMKFRKQ